jgi:hypothetical protein
MAAMARRVESEAMRLLTFLGIGCVAVALATVSVFLAVEKRAAAAAPDYRVATVGGIEYEAMDGRPVHPTDSVDRAIVGGVDRVRHGQMLFGAFFSVTNSSTRPLRSADWIELRDDAGRVYRPVALPVTNPYAYTPRLVRPHTRIPAQGSVADDNLAAGGKLLLFRIPAREYDSGGTFELVIHSAHQTGSLII